MFLGKKSIKLRGVLIGAHRAGLTLRLSYYLQHQGKRWSTVRRNK